MGSLSSWSQYQKFVGSPTPPGNGVTGQSVLLCAGPPLLTNLGSVSNLGGSDELVYPIGSTQNLALSSNRVFTRIFEIGSDRSFFISGRTVSQLTLARVYYHGPSLLSCLWAYYGDTAAEGEAGQFPNVERMWDTSFSDLPFPYKAGPSQGGAPQRFNRLHDVRIPPGFENFFCSK